MGILFVEKHIRVIRAFQALASIVLLFAIFFVWGNFMKVYQTDESYFMYKAWAIVNFDEQAISGYLPALYPYLLSKLVYIWGNDASVFEVARMITGILYLLSIFMFFIFFKNNIRLSRFNNFTSLFIATMLMFYVLAMRGFELRPEAIANFSMILSFLYLFSKDKHGKAYLVYISLFFALVSSFSSLRYTLPSIFVVMSSYFLLIRNEGFKYSHLLIFSVVVATFLFFIDRYVHKTNVFLDALMKYENTRAYQASAYSKVFELGLGKLAFLLERRGLYFSEYIRLGSFFSFVFISLYTLTRASGFERKAAVAMLILGGMSVYMFTLSESIPMNYVVSLEVIYCSLALLSMLILIGNVVKKYIIILALLPYIIGGLYSFVYLERNSISDFAYIETKADKYIYELSSERLFYHRKSPRGEYNLSSLSKIYNQICVNYEGYKVFTREFGYHPICIQDEYSHAYWLERLSFDEVESLIKQSASDVRYIGDDFILYKENL